MQDNQPVNLTYGQLSDMVNRIEQIPSLFGEGAPTSATPAFHLGQTYIDQLTSKLYYCSAIIEESGALDEYVWKENGDAYTAGAGIDITNQQIGIDADYLSEFIGTHGGIKTLTEDDYDYPDNNPDGIALWRLADGVYQIASGVKTYMNSANSSSENQTAFISSGWSGDMHDVTIFQITGRGIYFWRTNLNYTEGYAEETTNNTNLPFIKVSQLVQTTGNDQYNVMSQQATTSMVFADPNTKFQVQIGDGASSTLQGNIAIGRNSNSSGSGGVALGQNSKAQGPASVALGSGAVTTNGVRGEINIGSNATGYTTSGYNNSEYRLLTGLYNPQNAHDAANKDYVDTSITTAISQIVSIKFEVVSVLPPTGDPGTIYLLPIDESGDESGVINYYEEYIYVNNKWEKIGTTDIDLSDYATKDYVNQAIAEQEVVSQADWNAIFTAPVQNANNMGF